MDGTDQGTTLMGEAYLDTTEYKFGPSSFYSDDDGSFSWSNPNVLDCIAIADSDNWYFGSGDFTIDFWKHGHANVTYFKQYDDSTNYLNFYTNAGAWADFYIFKVVSGGVTLADYSISIPSDDGGWHHIELSRSGTDIYLFIDGISQTLTNIYTPISTNEMPNLYSDFKIGLPLNSFSEGDIKRIDEFRVSKGTVRHTSNFTPPTEPY